MGYVLSDSSSLSSILIPYLKVKVSSLHKPGLLDQPLAKGLSSLFHLVPEPFRPILGRVLQDDDGLVQQVQDQVVGVVGASGDCPGEDGRRVLSGQPFHVVPIASQLLPPHVGVGVAGCEHGHQLGVRRHHGEGGAKQESSVDLQLTAILIKLVQVIFFPDFKETAYLNSPQYRSCLTFNVAEIKLFMRQSSRVVSYRYLNWFTSFGLE